MHLLVLALTSCCLLLEQVAWAAFMIPGSPVRPKDFTLLKRDGVYHLFYIRNNTSVPASQNERDFGHAVSNDLYHWQQLPPVLHVDSLGWDNANVWAPHIVLRDSLYWMFYTGVQNVPGQYNYTQRMGLAVSSDLMNWTRQGLLFDNSQTNWAWWNPLKVGPACRDPFVMPDPERPGMWLMYYTASPLLDSTVTMVGIAESNGDFMQWDDLGPLTITYQAYSFNTLTESPHLFQHNGLWYLVVTTNAGQPLSIYTTQHPTGPLPDWTYRGRLRNMLGYDTNSWFASETARDGTHDLFAFVQGDRVEIREILWGSSWQFSLVQPPLFHVVRMGWAQPEVTEGQLTSLDFLLANPYAGQTSLEAFAVDSLGNETPLSMDDVGILEHPSFDSDTVQYLWYARRVPKPAPGDTTTVTRLRLRTVDRTADSGILTVRPASASPDTILPEDPPPADGDPGSEPGEWLGDRGSIRPLRSSPLGPGPALAVQIPEASDVRVDLYDLGGRRVRNLARRTLPAGITVLPWDGRGDDGTAQPRGMYFARLVSGRHVLTTRILLLPH
ncbi:MAG: family 43 glycosylhydrolase [Candidatus Eisenbacteria bacterium]|uniref:beta-fructofuranosidase n=1 Tax=Eiseniibacteriota bacterium TaxID=2212470 RepID=A0A933W495_UNCEI|nr:family 43 glycosylhydrolase [Candidatus Eisenbacteria bacterium]